MKKLLVLPVIALALAACGGGGTETVTEQAPAYHPPKPKIHLTKQELVDYAAATCVYQATQQGEEVSNSLRDCYQQMTTAIGYSSPYLTEGTQAGVKEEGCILQNGISACTPTKRQFVGQ